MALKSGWRAHRFDEMAVLVNDRVDDPSTAGVDRYVGLEHLDPDSLTIRRWGSPSDVEATKLRFRAGDIIFGRRRAYQRKLAVADFDGICSAHAMVLRANSAVALPKFLPFLLQSDVFMERAIEISVGSLSPTINWKTLANEEFFLPSLGEQEQIAALLAAVEKLRESLYLTFEAGRRQSEALRWASITGVTAPGRRQELAAWTHGQLPGVTELPEEWSLVRLTEVARLESGHTPSKRHPEYWAGNLPWVSLHDTGSLDRPWISQTEQTISELGLKHSSARMLPAGTVVVSRTATIGLCSVMSREMATSQDFANFICDEGRLLSRYLYYVFRAMKAHLTHIAAGSTHKTVYLPFFESMQILLPPISQQRAIVELLSRVDASHEAIEGRMNDCVSLGKSFGAALLIYPVR